MERKIVAWASILGILAIIFGAFGAHALKKVLTPEALASFETGVKYQVYHSLFLLFIASSNLISDKVKKILLILIICGVFLFSGSIYLLSCGGLVSMDFKNIGFITPIGGLLLISAWMTLFLHIIRRK